MGVCKNIYEYPKSLWNPKIIQESELGEIPKNKNILFDLPFCCRRLALGSNIQIPKDVVCFFAIFMMSTSAQIVLAS